MRTRKIDKPFLMIVLALVFVGFFIFSSASLGLLTREGMKFSSAMFNQVFFGLIFGSVAMFVTSRINYLNYRKYAFYIFLGSLVLTALVFSPLGFEHGGARRWLSLGSVSFQPAEFLKLGFIIYFAAWLASIRQKVATFKFGFLPMVVILALAGGLLFLQPDTGTILILFATAVGMFFVAGAKWKQFLWVTLIAIILFGGLVYVKPYILDRVMTFIYPTADVLDSGYQIKQSLIAVGSGQIFGRGFGKSIQKFNLLPEPIGDSIFAVTAEEWGFVGSVCLITLFLFFAYRGLYIATHVKDKFGRLLVSGIVILIVFQSFVNMASMLGIFPLTGMPLLFVSHGGTALMFTLLEVGIILNISKYKS